jgi:ferric-dicitrate binding protein FerR (iron transport regulator)
MRVDVVEPPVYGEPEAKQAMMWLIRLSNTTHPFSDRFQRSFAAWIASPTHRQALFDAFKICARLQLLPSPSTPPASMH